MAQKLLIAHPWLSDRATVTATSEASSMPASNLVRSPYPTDWFRALDPAALSITVHLPELPGLLWDFVAPLYTNSSEDGTWRITAAPSLALLDSAPTFEDEVRPCWPVPGMMLPGSLQKPGESEWRHAFRWLSAPDPVNGRPVSAPRSEPWIRIYWDDPNPVVPAGEAPFVQWGRLFISLAWRPTYSRDKGAGLTPALERARVARTYGGGQRRGSSPKPRRYRFNVGNLSHAEAMTRAYELARVVGASGQIVVIDDPEDALYLDRKFLCGAAEPTELRHEDYETNSQAYTLEEDL